jgi:two-component system, NtrC family, sensor kinase
MPRWELAAENILVKIRWFGLLVGYIYVNWAVQSALRAPMNAILGLGAGYALLDSIWSLRGRVFLGRAPLIVSAMEALFIGVLCYCQGSLDSPFRFYYLLSLICCALRHDVRITAATCALHCTSAGILYWALPADHREPFELLLTMFLLGWVTWAASSLGWLLKRYGAHVSALNDALRENQAQLEARIAERTRELHEAQAQLLHQEKMAAFGLLAAGIAHEVGNPLTAISSIVQMLRRRDSDAYTREKHALVAEQVYRIQGIVRELVNFSRPATTERSRLEIADLVSEAMGIAKYYKGMKSRSIVVNISTNLPTVIGVRGELVSVILNLVLNAIDATETHGRIEIGAVSSDAMIRMWIQDDGCGIDPKCLATLFQPFFTTKPQGTGLGLFMCCKLLTQHGGTISCESGYKAGARFILTLPAQIDAPPQSPARHLVAAN